MSIVATGGLGLALASCGGGSPTKAAGDTRPAAPSSTVALRIPSIGMAPTLEVGQIVRADLAAYRHSRPAIGDIVVFFPPAGQATGKCGWTVPAGAACPRPAGPRDDSTRLIKRVVAGPGDRLKLLHGRVYLDGKRQAEPFASRCGHLGDCDFPIAIRIPRGHYFLLGDNRGNSDDSRFWGPVPERWIIGRIVT